MSNILMKCGCVALATDSDGRLVCPIHIGMTPTAEQVEDSPPSLDGRMAECSYCSNKRPSDYSLPFFQSGRWHRGVLDSSIDTFYCGCRGWD